MAAKPPKPPATFLKQSSNNNSNSNKDDVSVDDSNGNSNNELLSTSTTAASAAVKTATASKTPTSNPLDAETYSKLGIRRYNSRDNLLNYINNDNVSEAATAATAAAAVAESSSVEGAAAVQRPTCNCTNISIMHLFHEMKQEFPTIPDPIVAQCVNENCHQRENCIQMLRNELALNPIPIQTYPAKVLQQHNINQQHNNQQQQQQQKQQQQQQRKNSLRTPPQPQPQPQPPQRQKNASPQKPPTPLRPVRAAPTTPPQLPARIRADAKHSSSVAPPSKCDSVELVQNNNRNLLKDVQSVHSAQCNNPGVDNKSNSNSNNNNPSGVSESSSKETCDMPVTAIATSTPTANASVDCARSSDFIAQLNRVATNPPPPLSPTQLGALGPRARPNTLNLQATQQQLQRQQLNKQLQQHLQQRSQLKQQPQDPPLQKPIRKAPLPPIAPKPVFHNNIGGYNNNANNNHNNNNSNNSCGNSPQSQSGTSYSTESNLTSPISSCSSENEISANVVSSTTAQAFAHRQNNSTPATSTTPTYQSAQPQPQPQPSSPLRSPIRHRSVINVQPEPPYTRDFLPAAKIGTSTATSPATTGGGGSGGNGSGASTPTSQKSFTSVNLTLRQPTAAVPQSTIDISAGPVLSGHGSGLTYSSTSYNARHGFKQNFHITVTEEGGVFNASRIGPRNSGYYAGIEESDSPAGPTGGSGQTASSAVRSPTSQQGIQNITTQAIQTAIATPTTTTGGEEMCLPYENSVFIETIKRQKNRRDMLAAALRENKKKLGDVEEEINMLIEPLNPSESGRLDYEIERLRSDCQQMLNEVEYIRRYGQLSEADRLKVQQQQQQQAFLRQRPPRPPPPIQQQQHQQQQQQQPQSPYQYPPTEQQQQQHNTPGSGSSSIHSSATNTPNTPHHLLHSPHYNQSTSGHAASTLPAPPAPPPYQQPSTDEEDYSDSNTDGGDDYEPLERWACSMCTFLNHPQLNICETCECVRIIPGTIRIVPSSAAASACGGIGAAAAAVGGAAATAMPAHGTLIAHNSATAAAAAAALTAATPTATAHGSSSPSAGNSPPSAARTVAAE